MLLSVGWSTCYGTTYNHNTNVAPPAKGTSVHLNCNGMNKQTLPQVKSRNTQTTNSNRINNQMHMKGTTKAKQTPQSLLFPFQHYFITSMISQLSHIFISIVISITFPPLLPRPPLSPQPTPYNFVLRRATRSHRTITIHTTTTTIHKEFS